MQFSTFTITAIAIMNGSTLAAAGANGSSNDAERSTMSKQYSLDNSDHQRDHTPPSLRAGKIDTTSTSYGANGLHHLGKVAEMLSSYDESSTEGSGAGDVNLLVGSEGETRHFEGRNSLRSGGVIVDNASILGEGGGVDARGGGVSKSGDAAVPGGSGDETKGTELSIYTGRDGGPKATVVNNDAGDGNVVQNSLRSGGVIVSSALAPAALLQNPKDPLVASDDENQNRQIHQSKSHVKAAITATAFKGENEIKAAADISPAFILDHDDPLKDSLTFIYENNSQQLRQSKIHAKATIVASVFDPKANTEAAADLEPSALLKDSRVSDLDSNNRQNSSLVLAPLPSNFAAHSSLRAILKSPHVQGPTTNDEEEANMSTAIVSVTNNNDEVRRLTNVGGGTRDLQTNRQCKYPTWHPVYSAGWPGGYCRYTIDCDSLGFSTELDCCQAAYNGQVGGFCLLQLDNPPTISPTDSEGGLNVYYPNYLAHWPEGNCINTRPLPLGRPVYASMLECCKFSYAGQMSGEPPVLTSIQYKDSIIYCLHPSSLLQFLAGKCISMLPTPPSSSPTNSDYEIDFWYAVYELPWDKAGCSNKLPLPYNNINDRPNYPTNLRCCKSEYGGQMSGKCLSELESPPTISPTGSRGADFWYANYENNNWSTAGCTNKLPLPFTTGGRPIYSTQRGCCNAEYGGQISSMCLCGLRDAPFVCFTTQTISVPSTITIHGIIIPSNDDELQMLIADLEFTIKTVVGGSLRTKERVVDVILISIGGVPVQIWSSSPGRRHLQGAFDVGYKVELEYDCKKGNCAYAQSDITERVIGVSSAPTQTVSLTSERPPLTITSETHSSLTLLRLPRNKAQMLIPNGMVLAPMEELAIYYPTIGDDFIIGLQMDRNKGFGPVIGPFGSLNFDIFMVIVPFCIIERSPEAFWTFRTTMVSSSWIAEVLTSIEYGASFHKGSVLFSPSDSGGSYNIGGDSDAAKVGEKGEVEAQATWKAAQEFHKPTYEDKQDAGTKLILALLKQPWSADQRLHNGSYYDVEIDSTQFRRCKDVKIHLNMPSYPDISGSIDKTVLISVEVKIPKLRESPFIIGDGLQQSPKPIVDHINDEGNIGHILTSGGCESLSKIQHLCGDTIAKGTEPPTEELLAKISSFIEAEAKGHFEVWDYLLRKYITDIKSIKLLTSAEYSSFPLSKILQKVVSKVGKTGPVFKNVGRNVVFQPERIITVHNFHDIVKALSEAKADQQSVKAVGTGHSYSLCLETGGYILETSGTLNAVANTKNPIIGQLSTDMLSESYKDILQIDGADLVYPKHIYDIETVDTNHALFECEAGITIKELMCVLYDNNLGLPNMGGAAWQTLAGYCSTSTHGSGLNFGPIAEGIQSLVLITTGEWKKEDWMGSPCRIKDASVSNPDGVYVYRIERYNGITNFDTYDDSYVSLLQCDDAFDSVRTSFGAFGVIYSITLLVQQFYWLEQVVTETTFESLLENQLAPNQEYPFPTNLTEPRNTMFYWSPYSQKPYKDITTGESSPHSVLWLESRVIEKPKGYKFKTSTLSHLQGSTRPTISNLVAKVVSQQVDDLFKSSPVKGFLTEIEEAIVYEIQQLQIVYDVTALLFRFAPRLIPFITNAAMTSQMLEGNKKGPYFHIMLLNVAQNAGFATEYAFPLQVPKVDSANTTGPTLLSFSTNSMGGDPYDVWPAASDKAGNYTIKNVANCLDVISKEAGNAVKMRQNYFTSPMGVRFVKDSQMHLSMMYGSNSSTIELDMAYGTPNGFQTLENIGPKILQAGGRFHWGLSIKEGQSDAELLEKAYPKLETWRKVVSQFNREKTFSNKFLVSLGLNK